MKGVILFWLAASASGAAQEATSPTPIAAADARPLPELHALVRAVVAHQRSDEDARKDYIYRESFHIDKLDGKGEIKQTELWEEDVFTIDGVEVHKKVSRDGKPLTPDEQKKEDARVEKDIAKGRKKKEKDADRAKDSDPDLEADTRLSSMLSAGSFSNLRRESHGGRDTILVDFTGDPKARTHMPIHEAAGTIAVDETTDTITDLRGEFFDDWKLLGGLVAKIDKGTRFSLSTVRINDEVWLPSEFYLEGEARVLLLFSGHVRVRVTDRDYRKFKATSTIVPGFREVEPAKP